MTWCAKSAMGTAFRRRQSAASYRLQAEWASASDLCSDKTFNVFSQNEDHVEVLGLKATPKMTAVGLIE